MSEKKTTKLKFPLSLPTAIIISVILLIAFLSIKEVAVGVMKYGDRKSYKECFESYEEKKAQAAEGWQVRINDCENRWLK